MAKETQLIGAHTSTAGGLDKAVERAASVGANCLQLFTKSNRQWRAKTITEHDIKNLQKAQNQHNIHHITAHAAYLINLGSKNDDVINKSITALSTELQRCDQLNIPYLVLHPGSARYDNLEKSLQFIAQNINIVFERTKIKNVTLLLETMAGQGNSIGYKFEQLATILQNIKNKNKEHLGVCFDTCHAFAAGYEFHTAKLYKEMWKNFDRSIGLSNLKAFHINDSKKECGSKVDRHEHIGEGKIPKEAFKFIMNDSKFSNIPKILETPAGEDEQTNDRKNINTLKELIY